MGFGSITMPTFVLVGQTGSKHYIILPRRGEHVVSWDLVLSSAASVLEIIRRGWGPDIMSIVCQLLHHGIPFNTCIRGPPPSQGSKQPKFIPGYTGLGYSTQGYKPDLIDYRAYESRRNKFLRSPRGRAALLAGGLISRLARGVVTEEQPL